MDCRTAIGPSAITPLMTSHFAPNRRNFIRRVRSAAGAVGARCPAGLRCAPKAMLHWALGHPVSALFGGLCVLLGAMVPVWLALALLPDLGPLRPPGVTKLEQHFAERGYSLAAVTDSHRAVPRLFLKSLPKDWQQVREVDRRKVLFLLATLPLVLRENERILAERRRLLGLRDRLSDGGRVAPSDRAWLQRLAEKYRLEDVDLVRLLRRVDAVPVSLALAQAAVESGWGTSRFAAGGNALFGQWTGDGEDAMRPQQRDAQQTHGVRRFDTLAASVAAYMANLNRHAAYRAFRRQRAELRNLGRRLTGAALITTLLAYSQRGADYIAVLRQVMTENDLARFDSARLSVPQVVVRPADEG